MLYSSFARLVNGDDFDIGWTAAWFELFLADLVRLWGTGVGAELANPSLEGAAQYREWFARYTRIAASPGMIAALMRMNAELDLRGLLPALTVPTLVLHRADEEWVSIEQSRFLARHIPGARLVELEGRDHWPWIGDAEPVLAEIERFVTDGQSRRPRALPFALGATSLSRREREVEHMTAAGLSNREIAVRLRLSERTVESHIGHVYRKLDVPSRIELVRRARELGL